MIEVVPPRPSVLLSRVSPVKSASPCGRPSCPSTTRTPARPTTGPVMSKSTVSPRGTAASRATMRGSDRMIALTKAAAEGESRLPGRPIAARMSCSCTQMSTTRRVRASVAVVGPKGPRTTESAVRAGSRSADIRLASTSSSSPATSAPSRGRRSWTKSSMNLPISFLTCGILGSSREGGSAPSSHDSMPTMWLIWSLTVHPGHSVCRSKSSGEQVCARSITACTVCS